MGVKTNEKKNGAEKTPAFVARAADAIKTPQKEG